MAYELQQLTDSLQPDYVEHDDGWNNQATLYLGNGDWLESADGSHPALVSNRNPFTMYVATEITTTIVAYPYLYHVWDSSDVNNRAFIRATTGATSLTLYASFGEATGSNDSVAVTVTHGGTVPQRLYICLRSDGDGLWLAVNDLTTHIDSDATLFTDLAALGVSFEYDSDRLGLRSDDILPWYGSLGHFQIKNVYHSDAQVQKMFDYYEGRFGAA